MKKIFLTGATGFIGSHLLSRLLEDNYQVILLVREANKLAPEWRGQVQCVVGDLNQPERYQGYLAQTKVMHLAADYRLGLAQAKQRRQMYLANVQGTLSLAKAALHAGIEQFIYSSTTAALGETHYQWHTETAQHNSVFRSYYEQSKHMAHQLLLALREQGLPLTMAILGGVFGEKDQSDLAQGLKQFLQGKVPAQPDTFSRFQLCHVDKVVTALVSLFDQPLGEDYLFTGKDYSMPELFALLSQLSGIAEPKKLALASLKKALYVLQPLACLGVKVPLNKELLNILDGSTYLYSSRKAQTELGWHAGDVEQDLTQYMQYLVEQNKAGL